MISSPVSIFLRALTSWTCFFSFQANSEFGTQEWLNLAMVGKIPFEHLEFEIPKAKLFVLQIPEKQKICKKSLISTI